MSVVDDVRGQIDARLAEVRVEMTQLENAKAALAGTNSTPTRASASRRTPSGAGPSTNARRTRAGRGRPRGSGQRARQAFELVQKQPGITIPELAEKMGIKQNYLYRVMPTLAGEGRVTKKDKGWHPVEG